MRLMTIFELAAKSEDELKVVFAKVAATASTEGSEAQSAIARASIENILRAMRTRLNLKR